MSISARRTRSVAVAAVSLTAAALAVAPMGAANAAPAPLPVTYDAVGTTHIAKPNSDIKLGPTVLSVALKSNQHFTGHLPIPQTSAAFNVAGFLPATAKVDFIEAAPVKGQLRTSGNRTFVISKAKYFVKLSDVTLGGFPTFVGDNCQTAAPVTVPARTARGQRFDLTTGGDLVGTYTIGDFANCGITTSIINQLVPGPGNTLNLTVSNGNVG